MWWGGARRACLAASSSSGLGEVGVVGGEVEGEVCRRVVWLGEAEGGGERVGDGVGWVGGVGNGEREAVGGSMARKMSGV